jgi:hypothetical protein
VPALRISFAVTLALATLPARALPQAGSDTSIALVLDALRTPASPAFTLLGVAPMTVERPTSPSALAVSLLSATGADDLLPRNYALELAPYWLVRHPDLTFDAYYRPGFLGGIVQSLSMSVATVPLDQLTAGVDSGTALGLGARAYLVPGRAHPDLAQRERELRAIQDASNRVLLDVEDEAVQQRLLDSLDALAQGIALEMQELDTERVGWLLELAGAAAFAFPGDRADSGAVERIGGWLTIAYRIPEPSLDLVAVARYERAQRATPARDLIGIGARLAWRLEDFTLSVEFLERLGDRAADGTRPGYRAAGNLEYRLPRLGFLTATFGSDDEGGQARFISTIGVNLGFGTIPLRLPGRP